ncbi:hypothetical protein PoB_001901400 [Plakobranchus ocellatus]|uniref:Uncharacterized protein n=1 Tax=Plakobranchus ocellatus TaxID=259542 RepID=A0AAV3ZDQ1_9GAST|nr:hypothetical protein PoB_001901400 [Plakobranchus ocellatus]
MGRFRKVLDLPANMQDIDHVEEIQERDGDINIGHGTLPQSYNPYYHQTGPSKCPSVLDPNDDLSTTVHWKLGWYGHVSKSSGQSTLVSRVRAPSPVPWPDRGPESLRSPCCALAIYKNLAN